MQHTFERASEGEPANPVRSGVQHQGVHLFHGPTRITYGPHPKLALRILLSNSTVRPIHIFSIVRFLLRFLGDG